MKGPEHASKQPEHNQDTTITENTLSQKQDTHTHIQSPISPGRDESTPTAIAAALIDLEEYEKALAVLEEIGVKGIIEAGSTNDTTEEAASNTVGDPSVDTYDPEAAEAWKLRGLALYYLNRHQEALAAFETFLEWKPGETKILSNIGHVLALLGRLDEALAVHERAVTAHPTIAVFWSNMALTLRLLNRDEDELAALDRALELDPARTSSWINRGQVLQKLKQGYVE